MHEHHLLQLLSGIIEWIDPPDAVSRAIESGKSERFMFLTTIFHRYINCSFYISDALTLLVIFSEMLDGCRALLSIANITYPAVFDQLLKSTRLVAK